jgi:hypothetical protein
LRIKEQETRLTLHEHDDDDDDNNDDEDDDDNKLSEMSNMLLEMLLKLLTEYVLPSGNTTKRFLRECVIVSLRWPSEF